MNELTNDSEVLPDLNSFRFPSNSSGITDNFGLEEYELNPDSIMEVDASTRDQNDMFLSKFHFQQNTNGPFRSYHQHPSNGSNISTQHLRNPTSPTSPISSGNSRNSVDSTLSSMSSKFSYEVPSSRVKELDSTFQFENSYNPKGKRKSIYAPISPFGTRYEFEKPRLSSKKDISSSFLTSDRISKFNPDINSENTLDLYKTSLSTPPTPRRVSVTPSKKYRHSRNLSICSSPVSPQEQSNCFSKESANSIMNDSRKHPPTDNNEVRRTMMNEYTYQDKLIPTSHSDLRNWTNTQTDTTNKDEARSISYEEFDDKNTGLVKSSSSSVYSICEGEIMTLKHQRPSIVYITTDATTQTLDLGRIEHS